LPKVTIYAGKQVDAVVHSFERFIRSGAKTQVFIVRVRANLSHAM